MERGGGGGSSLFLSLVPATRKHFLLRSLTRLLLLLLSSHPPRLLRFYFFFFFRVSTFRSESFRNACIHAAPSLLCSRQIFFDPRFGRQFRSSLVENPRQKFPPRSFFSANLLLPRVRSTRFHSPRYRFQILTRIRGRARGLVETTAH